ncbi:MAG: AAA family ATPase [Chlorobiales bacterium]|nr:AAA family ATPase [Chlorobiales bacterium]
MIQEISIENFRSIKKEVISLEENITVIVGENDSGKTSVIDALKALFENLIIDTDDFHCQTTKIILSVKTKQGSFFKEFEKLGERIEQKSYLRLAVDYLNNLKDSFSNEEFESLEENKQKEVLKKVCGDIGITVRATSVATLKSKAIERIEELIVAGESVVVEGSIPAYNVYFLDGRRFENISSFFQELFFKEQKRKIWNEKVDDDYTVEEFVKNRLDEYSKTIKDEIGNRGIKDNLKKFLPNLTDIDIKSNFEPKDINIDVKVRFLEGGNEIPADKKGDGTKRRITMALLDYKKTTGADELSLYVFDEPDTHLHVKAQRDLLDTLKEFYESGRQVIVTTHSPFIVNSVHPSKVRLLAKECEKTVVKKLDRDEDIDRTLKLLGVENTYLFFAKKILIVEGDTEDAFFPVTFEKLHGQNLNSLLVKVMNVKGVKNIHGFADALSRVLPKDSVFILVDSDFADKAERIIQKLDIPNRNQYKIGEKEFEDAFSPEILHKAWKCHLEDNGQSIPDGWTVERIEALRYECILNGSKFSDKLGGLTIGCQIGWNKTCLGIALAMHCQREHIPEPLLNLMENLK